MLSRQFVLSIVILCQLSSRVSGQRAYNYYPVKNTFFVEGATRGPIYSINYERIFRFGDILNYSYRIGASYFDSRMAGSLGINAFQGEGPHHSEMSILVQPSAMVTVKQPKPSDLGSNFIGTVGYRYQRLDAAGLFIKAGFGVILIYDPPVVSFRNVLTPNYIGVLCLGYSF